MYDLRDREFLGKLNSATKYPETPTYHAMDKKSGLLQEGEVVDFIGNSVQVSEKIDGTNGRIIILPATCKQDWVIGSREDLLSCSDDHMINPSLGIVDALKETADKIYNAQMDIGVPMNVARVYFFEVFGGRVGKNFMHYSTKPDVFGHRLFDVIEFSPEDFDATMSYDREAIAGWRDRGNQPFMNWRNFSAAVQELGLKQAQTLIANFEGGSLPRTFEESLEFLEGLFPDGSYSRLDPDALGRPEGVVLKSFDRKQTAKMRFTDYESTIRRRKEAADSAAKQRLRDTVTE